MPRRFNQHVSLDRQHRTPWQGLKEKNMEGYHSFLSLTKSIPEKWWHSKSHGPHTLVHNPETRLEYSTCAVLRAITVSKNQTKWPVEGLDTPSALQRKPKCLVFIDIILIFLHCDEKSRVELDAVFISWRPEIASWSILYNSCIMTHSVCIETGIYVVLISSNLWDAFQRSRSVAWNTDLSCIICPASLAVPAPSAIAAKHTR